VQRALERFYVRIKNAWDWWSNLILAMWKWDFHRSIPKGKKATVWLFVFDASRPAQEYHYLNQSDCLSIDNIDDAEQFHILRVCWTNWLHYQVWDAINLVLHAKIFPTIIACHVFERSYMVIEVSGWRRAN